MIEMYIIVKYGDLDTDNWKTEYLKCIDVAYDRYEFLKKTYDCVELGAEVNGNYIWLLKWGSA